MRLLHPISLAVFLVSARAQSFAQPQPPSGSGQEITIDNLQGTIISAVIEYSGRVRWSGDNIVRPLRHNWRLKMQIDQGGSFKSTADTESWVAGRKFTEHFPSQLGSIGRPNTKPERIGARAAVMTLEGNTLTLLRVFERGGRIVKIMLSRIGSGFGCTATGTYVQEIGAGNPKAKAPRALGGHYELIGMKQTSSTCRVSKK